MQNLKKNCLFLKKIFSVSWIFPDYFLVISVQEDPRNNKSVESGLRKRERTSNIRQNCKRPDIKVMYLQYL